MTKDEALRLALEAMKINNKAWKLLADSGDAGNWEAEEQGYYQLNEQAIIAIKEALETKEGLLDRKSYLLGLYDQKPWVGLTDEDMNNALDYWSDNSRSAYGGAHAANGEYVDMIETWRYIETKLKERNI